MTPSLLRMAGDERLARMVTSGNDGAFSALYDRYHDVLVRYCRSLVRDDQDALDAFQSTMLNALRALREDRRRAPVRPWLFRIAHNESISVLRRRPASEPLDDRQIGTVDVHRTAEDREALAGLLEDLGSLTEHQRGALLLRELGGLAYEDVATALETTPLAARQAVFAARASLHDQREGRELPCAMVQRRLSDADRRASRTRAVRAHLRACDDCRGFATAIGRRRRAAVLVPIPPAFASAGLLTSILDASGGAGGAIGGGVVASGLVAKAAVALSAAVVATGAAERGGSVVHRATGGATATAEAKAETTKPKTTTAAAPSAAPVQVARATTTRAPASTRSAAQATGEEDDAAPDLADERDPVRLSAHDGQDARDGSGDGSTWGDGHRGGSYGDGTRFPASAGGGAGAGASTPGDRDQASRPIAARPRRPSGAVTPMAASTTTTSTPAAETETETAPATTTTTTAAPTTTSPSPAEADPAETATTPTTTTPAEPTPASTTTTEATPAPE